MNWYYADGGQQRGPVTEAELAGLIQSGVVRPETLVWRDGMAEWRPLAEARPAALASTSPQPAVPAVPPMAPAPTAGTADGTACAGCGRRFIPEDLVDVAGSPVCAACKPMMLQRLSEGAAGTPHGAGTSWDEGTLGEEDVLARDYEVPAGEAVQAGARELFGHAGTLLLGGALVTLVMFAIQAVPYLGPIAALILQGPLMGGLILACLKHLRTGRMEVGDAFQGFGPRFWPLCRAHVIPTLFASLAYIPVVIMVVAAAVVGIASGAGMPSITGVSVLVLAMAGVLLVGGVLVGTYLTVSWIYTLPLVADRGYRVLPAMKLSRRFVGRHFWQHLFLMILLGLVGLLGFIACIVGIFVAFPIIMFAQAFVYNRLFKGLRPAQQTSF